VRDDRHLVFHHKLLGEDGIVRRGIVVVKQPGLFLPKFRATSSHVFTQSPQNFAVESGNHSLAFWDKFFVLPQLLCRWRHQSGNILVTNSVFLEECYLCVMKCKGPEFSFVASWHSNWATKWTVRFLNTSRDGKFFLSPSRPDQLRCPSSLHYYRVFLSGVDRRRHDVDQLLLSSAEHKNEWSYTSVPPYTFMN
jgi:hypothetical protein